MSIFGHKDIPVVSRLPVPLTTVRVPFRQIAADALRLLLDDGPGTGETLVSAPALIPRGSPPHHGNWDPTGRGPKVAGWVLRRFR